MTDEKHGEEILQEELTCPECGSLPEETETLQSDPVEEAPTEECTQVQMPMKWHNCLVRFLLYFAAVVAALFGLGILRGDHIGINADLVYNYYTGLKTVDTAYGVILIAAAFLAVGARFALAQYRKFGPGLLIAFLIALPAVNVLYKLVMAIYLGGMPFDTVSLGILVVGIALIALHIAYYRKREHLFVN